MCFCVYICKYVCIIEISDEKSFHVRMWEDMVNIFILLYIGILVVGFSISNVSQGPKKSRICRDIIYIDQHMHKKYWPVDYFTNMNKSSRHVRWSWHFRIFIYTKRWYRSKVEKIIRRHEVICFLTFLNKKNFLTLSCPYIYKTRL